MILRLSQRLAKKIKAGKLDESSIDDNPFADWSCRIFITNRKQYIILSNTMSLYSCLMEGKGITNRDLFVGKTVDTIGAFMSADRRQQAYQQFVVPASGSVSFSKSLNRSVTGSMSDHVHAAKLHLSDGMDAAEIGFRLNVTPLSALIGADGRKYGNPGEVFQNLADKM